MTDAERLLWYELKGRRFCGFKFRRQRPIGPYIVDFFCPKAKLIIEIDGGQHAMPGYARRDKMRSAWLEAQGYRVLRFWNNDVLSNLPGVLQIIVTALAERPPLPGPPPQGGREPRRAGSWKEG